MVLVLFPWYPELQVVLEGSGLSMQVLVHDDACACAYACACACAGERTTCAETCDAIGGRGVGGIGVGGTLCGGIGGGIVDAGAHAFIVGAGVGSGCWTGAGGGNGNAGGWNGLATKFGQSCGGGTRGG
ncbi:Hypothetical predicted protein [Olea europaea subsp. europaea]|uniref:Uncharacterized protein n=1 Tax=Olea europaea subsp. europaea TaxID=158383 RepID=A0A8S0PWC3_OLEEU|nr:Hypothetical predicted protein [Olea europaea subsp. europaea]